MNIFVINLKERADRRENIRLQLTGYEYEIVDAINGKEFDFEKNNVRPFRKWADPLLARELTEGEIACTLSHIEVWKKIAASGKPGIVLEDDSIAMRKMVDADIETALSEYDMVYLHYKEMSPGLHRNNKFNGIELTDVVYPYHASAYAITSEFASYLLSLNLQDCVIPVDEFFPILNGIDESNLLSDAKVIKKNFEFLIKRFNKKKSKIAAFTKPYFTQASREEFGSDIESNTFPIRSVVPLTVGTDNNEMYTLIDSIKKFNISAVNLGLGRQWNGGDMANGSGGGQKLNLVYDFIDNIQDRDIVLFVDGYDVMINDDIETIVGRFYEADCDILFAAEKACWPDKSIADQFPESHTEYRFLNSGCYIGYRWAIARLLQNKINDCDDDQLYLQKRYLETLGSDDLTIKLDYENYLFQCICFAEKEVCLLGNGQLYNTATNTCPCILHGNGGGESKTAFLNLYNKIYHKPNFKPITNNLKVVGPDILAGDFFTPQQCSDIIKLSEEFGVWKSLDGDKFPGQEIRVNKFSPELFAEIREHLLKNIGPAIEKYWWPLQLYDIRDMFIIKYNEQSQSYLSCHHDASLVSGIIKLNDGYEGGDTYFHRQNYSNKDVPVGDIVLWPGQVTHGHEGRQVTSGTKYNLVIWTSRYNGDING